MPDRFQIMANLSLKFHKVYFIPPDKCENVLSGAAVCAKLKKLYNLEFLASK